MVGIKLIFVISHPRFRGDYLISYINLWQGLSTFDHDPFLISFSDILSNQKRYEVDEKTIGTDIFNTFPCIVSLNIETICVYYMMKI